MHGRRSLFIKGIDAQARDVCVIASNHTCTDPIARLAHRDAAVRPHRSFGNIVVAVALVTASVVAHAGLDAQGQREVAALLSFVGQSHCTFIRNGKSYSAADAKNHLELKLNYLLERDKVNSAEEFIDRAGTQSSFSGRPYLVNCGGADRPSADWLKDELRVLRTTPP